MMRRSYAGVGLVLAVLVALASAPTQSEAFGIFDKQFGFGHHHHHHHPFARPSAASSCELWPHHPRCRAAAREQQLQRQQQQQLRQEQERRHRQQHLWEQQQRALTRERVYKVVDAGEAYQLQIEAPEHNKRGLFDFGFSDSDEDPATSILRVTDRANPVRFDREFKLPEGVPREDLRVRWDRDIVTLIVPKQGPPPAQDASRRETLNVPKQVTLPKVQVTTDANNDVVRRGPDTAVEANLDSDLLIEDAYDEADDHELLDADAASGYVDNRGVFREY